MILKFRAFKNVSVVSKIINLRSFLNMKLYERSSTENKSINIEKEKTHTKKPQRVRE